MAVLAFINCNNDAPNQRYNLSIINAHCSAISHRKGRILLQKQELQSGRLAFSRKLPPIASLALLLNGRCLYPRTKTMTSTVPMVEDWSTSGTTKVPTPISRAGLVRHQPRTSDVLLQIHAIGSRLRIRDSYTPLTSFLSTHTHL
jgi:hypothetical protein